MPVSVDRYEERVVPVPGYVELDLGESYHHRLGLEPDVANIPRAVEVERTAPTQPLHPHYDSRELLESESSVEEMPRAEFRMPEVLRERIRRMREVLQI